MNGYKRAAIIVMFAMQGVLAGVLVGVINPGWAFASGLAGLVCILILAVYDLTRSEP